MGWACRTCGDMKNSYKMLLSKGAGKDHLKDTSVQILVQQVAKTRKGFIWLWIRTGSGLFWIRYYILCFHKTREISSPTERLSVSQEDLYFMELII
jgi:hypothetical protein